MSLSRRQFIQASGIALCAGAMPLTASAAGQQQPLPIPPLIESRRGQPLFLTLQRSHWSFTQGTRAPVWGINGRYLGPTIRVWNGDDVKLIYSNRTPENVAMTISGLQVPGPLIGGAARMMSPSADWAPVLPIRQSAATLWYHANTPNRTAQQVYNGLAGMWLVEDEVSKSLPIPNHYGVDDFPVIIQDKRLDNFGTPEYSEPGSGGFVGDTLLVNGAQSPYVEVSRGWVRLRLLNASNSRRYQLQMSDGRPLHVISGDQGFLPAPVSVKQLALSPGERREVLIDMTNGDEVSVTCGEAASIVDRIRGFFEPSSILVSTLVLTLRPTGLLPLVTDSLPMRLLPPPKNQLWQIATMARQWFIKSVEQQCRRSQVRRLLSRCRARVQQRQQAPAQQVQAKQVQTKQTPAQQAPAKQLKSKRLHQCCKQLQQAAHALRRELAAARQRASLPRPKRLRVCASCLYLIPTC